MKNQQIHQLFNQFINYVWQLLHVSELHCHLQGAFLVPSERCSIEEQSIEYCGCGVLCLVTWCAPRTTSLDTTRHNIHNILSTASHPRTTSLDTTHPSTIFYRLL